MAMLERIAAIQRRKKTRQLIIVLMVHCFT
jgi:hypothetical protein